MYRCPIVTEQVALFLRQGWSLISYNITTSNTKQRFLPMSLQTSDRYCERSPNDKACVEIVWTRCSLGRLAVEPSRDTQTNPCNRSIISRNRSPDVAEPLRHQTSFHLADLYTSTNLTRPTYPDAATRSGSPICSSTRDALYQCWRLSFLASLTITSLMSPVK